ncbi:MAG: Biopolymer transport protein ExbD/TolR [Bacteroidota bacterium]|jgi:biopolymer transport protein ExbD|nr:Biopolymer transport protein ExbD/TolR [Bacteroidota bacterium]
MGLRKKAHRDAEVSTESLNDIMFFLLLFFLILSTMVSPNAIKVNLPSSKPTKPVDNNKKPIHLDVSNNRNYFVEGKEIEFSALEGALVAEINGNPEPTVVLQMDKDLSIQDAVDVMIIVDKLKCKMVWATKPSNGK